MTSRILTVPNQLTFLRLAFLPFFIMAIHYERYNWALSILNVAGLSDAPKIWSTPALMPPSPIIPPKPPPGV